MSFIISKINKGNNMQITSLHNTNTGFKATLDVSSVKLNKTRWNSIAKIFNEESKSIPNGLLRVFHDEKQCCLIGYTDKGAHTLRNSILADLSTETGPVVFGEKVTVPTEVPVQEGFEFAGWKAEDGTVYQPGDEIADAMKSKLTLR